MIAADIDTADLDRAIAALKTVEPEVIEPEFRKAAQQTVEYWEKDLKTGVAFAYTTGDLRDAISGKVTQVAGADVDMLISDLVTHGGYAYAGRLDKDGGLRWRTGKFRGRRTFGWFSYTLKTKGPGVVRRYFRKAVEVVVEKLARKI